MGTNYYTCYCLCDDHHVGKLSGAGLYCYNCRLTLCKEGEGGVHFSKSCWFDHCPRCGRRVDDGPPWRPDKRVDTCVSFTWALSPERALLLPPNAMIYDEYGKKTGLEEFKEMVRDIPIHYYDSIGEIFC